MRIKQIKIGNYKSIGEEQSLYLGENNVISIIGKNETGKSNILSILSELSFHKNLDLKTFEKIFLGPQYFSNETNSKVQITLELIEDEKSFLGIESNETKVVFFVENNRPDIAIEGSISEYFLLEEYLNLV